MNLTMHNYLERAIKTRVKDSENELKFFFDAAVDFIVSGTPPFLPSISVSEKRDLVHVLKTIDQDIIDLGMAVDWDDQTSIGGIIYHPMDGVTRERRGKLAFERLSSLSDVYLEKLFYFYCLAAMFYGGITKARPSIAIDKTFPFEVFDGLKPYLTAKKLEKEFSGEERNLALALKSIDSVDVEPVAWLPPYADENSYIEYEGETYLVYDILAGDNK